jgi:16S rRNA (guanine527-N7)-methyltransferase
MTIRELSLLCEENGLLLSGKQLETLEKYAELLQQKNQVVNLISRKDEENIISKHILHSLTLLFTSVPIAGIPLEATVFDLGTGGGLPGIPIKIARPDIVLTLCDSIAKKMNAVSEIAKALDLKITAITDRAENISLKSDHKHKYDVVVTRAVASLADLVKWSHTLYKKSGILLALKGGNIDEEIVSAKKVRSVSAVEETSLAIRGYGEFEKEEKKIVRVKLV